MNDPRLRKTNTYTTITHIQNTLVRMRSPPTRSVVFTVHPHAHTHPHLFACAHPHPRALRSDAQTCSPYNAHIHVLSEWVYDILGIRGICGNHDDRVAGDGRA